MPVALPMMTGEPTRHWMPRMTLATHDNALTDEPFVPQAMASFVTNRFGDRYLYHVNRESLNRTGAHATFEAEFRERLFRPDTLHIVIGSDSGLLIQHIRERGLPPGSRYLFIELPEVYHALAGEGLLDEVDERIVCALPENWRQTAEKLKILDYFYIDAVEIVESLAAQYAYLDDYRALSWTMREAVNQQRWQATTQLGNESFIRRQLENVCDNLQPSSLLKNAFNGATAVILAGGPSLDEQLDWIRQHRDRLVLIAVSRIATRLQQVELTPDFIFSVDPTDLSYDISKAMLKFDTRTVFINQYHVVPRLLAQWPHRHLYMGALLPWKSPLNPAEALNTPGPTVTNAAIHAAHYMGFRHLILAGVDLCFTREGHTHAVGSNEHRAGPRFDLTALQVTTNGGWEANTTPDFASAISSLGIQARQLRVEGTTLYNAAAGAARIEDVRHCTSEDLPLPEQPVDVEAVLVRRLPSIERPARLAHAQALLREFTATEHQVSKIRDLAIEALECNARMYADGLIVEPTLKRRLDRIEKNLRRQHRELNRLVKIFGIRDLLRVAKPFTDFDAMTADEAQSLGQLYYEAFRDGAERLLQPLTSGIERIEMRLEEETDQPDIERLIAFWRKEQMPGRARLWRTRHPQQAATLPPEHQAALDTLDRAFHAELEEQETAHMRRARHHSDLRAIPVRARALLQRKDRAALDDLRQAIDRHPQADTATDYAHLVDGYLAEIDQDDERAIEAYYPLVTNPNSPVLEDALVRVAGLSLNQGNHDNARFALECLAALSPTYHLQYAEILRLTGDILGAIDVYNAHIQQFPDDIQAQLRLARLYLDIDLPDAARLLLEHMLTQHPEHSGARTLMAGLH